MGEDFGYDEINLNVAARRIGEGCRWRLSDGEAGASRRLLSKPEARSEPCRSRSMPDRHRRSGPGTALDVLARSVIAAGADALIVHARKAWLNGLSPKKIVTSAGSTMTGYIGLRPRCRCAHHHQCGIGSSARPNSIHFVDGVMLGRAALSGAVAVVAADPDLFGEAAPHAVMKTCRGCHALYRARTRARHAAAFDHAAFSLARFMECRCRAGVSPPPRRERRQPGAGAMSCATPSHWSIPCWGLDSRVI